jgi:hypothetical protein
LDAKNCLYQQLTLWIYKMSVIVYDVDTACDMVFVCCRAFLLHRPVILRKLGLGLLEVTGGAPFTEGVLECVDNRKLKEIVAMKFNFVLLVD